MSPSTSTRTGHKSVVHTCLWAMCTHMVPAHSINLRGAVGRELLPYTEGPWFVSHSGDIFRRFLLLDIRARITRLLPWILCQNDTPSAKGLHLNDVDSTPMSIISRFKCRFRLKSDLKIESGIESTSFRCRRIFLSQLGERSVYCMYGIYQY